MEIEHLAERLRDSDPRVRVETLRILAMVEETRALEAVRWIFQNDPEPGVREVADWAGRLIWEAQQRGHSTQRALEELFARPMSAELQALFLASQSQYRLQDTRNREAQRYATDQTYRRQLDNAFRGEETPQFGEAALPLLPAETISAALPAKTTVRRSDPARDNSLDQMDDLALLDAGLSEHFWDQ
jgi:hypothetical protein